MNHELTKFGRRLLHDTNGQVLLLGVIVIVALLAFMLAIPNGTQVTTQKMRAQTAADAGAFTGAVWRARALNLNANMNVGIKSMYTWMTVLTTASALAKALYSDSLDASVRALGQDVSLALFGNNDPVYVSSSIYPQSIQKLAETARWLYDLQGDIAGSFPAVAATLGSAQARRNASGGNPSSQNPGGMVLVGAEALLSLSPSRSGDSLMYADLNRLAVSLQVIPTNDDNIGPATGVVLIDTHNFEIKAYYGDSSQWCTVRQVLKRMYKKPIIQTFRNKSTGVIDTGMEYFQKPGGGPYTSYLHGDSWARWVWKCNEGGTHTPFIWPNPQTYKNASSWELVEAHPGNNRYKRDTVWVRKHVVKKSDPSFGKWNTGKWDPGDSILPECRPWVNDSGDEVDSSIAYPTDFYTGADSTRGNQGTKLRPRRLSPGTGLYAASYVWWLGDNHAPFGLGPAIGKTLFPRSRVAASCPMLAVARAETYLAGDVGSNNYFIMQTFQKLTFCHYVYDTGYRYFDAPTGKTWTDYLNGDSLVTPFTHPPWTLIACDSGSNKCEEADYFFTPAWDVRLIPLDSAAVREIYTDTAYVSHNLTPINIEGLRKYVLLP